MKILIVTPGCLPIPASLGGAIEDYILNLGKELTSLGADVKILDIPRSSLDRNSKTEMLQGIEVIRIPKYIMFPSSLEINNLLMRSKQLLDELMWGLSVRRFIELHLRDERFSWDVVHFNSPLPLIINSKFLTKNGIKIIYTEHTYFASRRSGTWFYRKILEPKIESMVLSSSTVIALSKNTARSLITLKKSRLYIIPLGIDAQYFHLLTDKEREKALEIFLPAENKASFIITFLGRIHPQKGIDVLIKAAKNLKDHNIDNFVLLLAGPLSGDFSITDDKPSPYALRIMRIVKKYGIQQNIRFLGRIPQEHKVLLFGISSVFVLPSYYETFGLVALEAMAAGVPVVGTNVGALPDIIKNDFNGYLFEPGNSKKLSSILIKLYKDRELLKRLAENAKETAKAYSWRRIAELTYDVYKRL